MITPREQIVASIVAERDRQHNLPGREFDVRNTPNDWAAIIAHYTLDEVRRGVELPRRDGFEDRLIKAAAVILAALEHAPIMDQRGCFAVTDTDFPPLEHAPIMDQNGCFAGEIDFPPFALSDGADFDAEC